MKSLGIDIGSSSVKVSLMDIETGACVASATQPAQEMPIEARHSGWAEQDPDLWWYYVGVGLDALREAGHPLDDVRAVGITYQMHGLVCVDCTGHPLRKAIIWCDSRAVEIGAEALETLGRERCLEHLLNSPGNFTASKLAWVRRNEPELFARIDKVMLPGDYIAFRLSGDISTTVGGLSEQILWDFAEERFGIPAGTPISYRAGDQPNNAFSLNVLKAGEVAATGGTSGVVYGVVDTRRADPLSRVNTFVHVNHRPEQPRYGILLCINGTGIMNSWMRRNVTQQTLDYAAMNRLAESVPVGSDGLLVVPFGNGAERVLGNRCPGACIHRLDLNRHTTAHLLRATQEGIAFSFRYGLDLMRPLGLNPAVIRAGAANLFLSPRQNQPLDNDLGTQNGEPPLPALHRHGRRHRRPALRLRYGRSLGCRTGARPILPHGARL